MALSFHTLSLFVLMTCRAADSTGAVDICQDGKADSCAASQSHSENPDDEMSLIQAQLQLQRRTASVAKTTSVVQAGLPACLHAPGWKDNMWWTGCQKYKDDPSNCKWDFGSGDNGVAGKAKDVCPECGECSAGGGGGGGGGGKSACLHAPGWKDNMRYTGCQKYKDDPSNCKWDFGSGDNGVSGKAEDVCPECGQCSAPAKATSILQAGLPACLHSPGWKDNMWYTGCQKYKDDPSNCKWDFGSGDNGVSGKAKDVCPECGECSAGGGGGGGGGGKSACLHAPGWKDNMRYTGCQKYKDDPSNCKWDFGSGDNGVSGKAEDVCPECGQCSAT